MRLADDAFYSVTDAFRWAEDDHSAGVRLGTSRKKNCKNYTHQLTFSDHFRLNSAYIFHANAHFL